MMTASLVGAKKEVDGVIYSPVTECSLSNRSVGGSIGEGQFG
jgi:3-oxoacyl-(acyl-carrier-protein) synthase